MQLNKSFNTQRCLSVKSPQGIKQDFFKSFQLVLVSVTMYLSLSFVVSLLNAHIHSKRKNEPVVAACIILNSLMVRVLSWEQLTIEL